MIPAVPVRPLAHANTISARPAITQFVTTVIDSVVTAAIRIVDGVIHFTRAGVNTRAR